MPEADPNTGQRERSSGVAPLEVAIINDYEVVVDRVRAVLSAFPGQVATVELDVDQPTEHTVDIALFDTYGQPNLGLHRVRALAHSHRIGSVAIYAWNLTDRARKAAYHAGARAFISKTLSPPEFVASLQAVAEGQNVHSGGFRGTNRGPWPGSHWGLSARESEVLALVTTGMSNKAIGEALFVSENTVRTHLKSVFLKLHVSNRTHAVARAVGDRTFVTRHAPKILPPP